MAIRPMGLACARSRQAPVARSLAGAVVNVPVVLASAGPDEQAGSPVKNAAPDPCCRGTFVQPPPAIERPFADFQFFRGLPLRKKVCQEMRWMTHDTPAFFRK